jgi:hypothetical protein
MDNFFQAKAVAALLVDSEAPGIAFDSWVSARGGVLSGDPTDPIPVVVWPNPLPNALPSAALH